MEQSLENHRLVSMTGFAAAQGAEGAWSWSAEIRAVNGRTLDLRFRLPDIEGLEPELRKRLQARLSRGNITTSIRLQRAEGAAALRLNEAGLAEALELLHAIRARAGASGLDVPPSSATDIAQMRGVIDSDAGYDGETQTLRAAILTTFETCLDAFVADREREGNALAGVIAAQIDRIATLAERADAAVGDREAAQRAAMETALKRLMETTEIPDEARMRQELAQIAVKTDITEELDRLAAHVAAARSLIAAEGPVGRKLDFLMQEFNREANTLCSKAQSAALTAIGLDLKTVIDQMREQVQNIE